MKPTVTARSRSAERPSRLLVVLAAAWMILSLAIGGAVTAETRQSANDQAIISTATAH
jgi:hypothetical protein